MVRSFGIFATKQTKKGDAFVNARMYTGRNPVLRLAHRKVKLMEKGWTVDLIESEQPLSFGYSTRDNLVYAYDHFIDAMKKQGIAINSVF